MMTVYNVAALSINYIGDKNNVLCAADSLPSSCTWMSEEKWAGVEQS